jgi:hypothetical protein
MLRIQGLLISLYHTSKAMLKASFLLERDGKCVLPDPTQLIELACPFDGLTDRLISRGIPLSIQKDDVPD